MRQTPDTQIALSRFGLGPRPGDRDRVAADPRGAVRAELDRPGALTIPDKRLQGSQALYRAVMEVDVYRRVMRGTRLNKSRQLILEAMIDEGRAAPGSAEALAKARGGGAADDAPDMAPPPPERGMAPDREMADGRDMGGARDMAEGMEPPREMAAPADKPKVPDTHIKTYRFEASKRFDHALTYPVGFPERLTQFWANHFAVSKVKDNYCLGISGAYEREAIRPFVLGRFSDMLVAATRHPVMLYYLDAIRSLGPNSRVGLKRGTGLNENHARELLELHTLGVDGGYTQTDVTAFAKVLTGWTVGAESDDPDFGAFRFRADYHEPGPQTVLGKRYAAKNDAQGVAVLEDLARHPSTARHIARRLATAFVADDPPQALVARLTKVFRDTDGDLAAVSAALVDSDEAWAPGPPRMRSPQEWLFSVVRALDAKQNAGQMLRAAELLGQPIWSPPSPEGFSIRGRDWLSPDGLTNRLDVAQALAARNVEKSDPDALADDLFGPALTDETRTAVKRAGSREQALALLFMSPEMQRR